MPKRQGMRFVKASMEWERRGQIWKPPLRRTGEGRRATRPLAAELQALRDAFFATGTNGWNGSTTDSFESVGTERPSVKHRTSLTHRLSTRKSPTEFSMTAALF